MKGEWKKIEKVKCDECNKLFTINPKERKHGQGVRETYFICPYCDQHYTAFVTNTEIRKRQREIKKLSDSLSKIKDIETYQQGLERINNRKTILKPMMDKLKDKIKTKALK